MRDIRLSLSKRLYSIYTQYRRGTAAKCNFKTGLTNVSKVEPSRPEGRDGLSARIFGL